VSKNDALDSTRRALATVLLVKRPPPKQSIDGNRKLDENVFIPHLEVRHAVDDSSPPYVTLKLIVLFLSLKFPRSSGEDKSV
jgi:hypothetical protein